MKKLYFLLLLSSVAFAQPAIQNPDPIAMCDDNNDGYEFFDLSPVDGYVLGALDPSTHTVTIYETQVNAETGNPAMAISTGSLYASIQPNIQTLYIRVVENSNSTLYATTTIQLIVNSFPVVPVVDDMIVYENPFDGFATFDLTTQIQPLSNGMAGVNIVFYLSEVDAEAQANPLSTAFTNTTNPQQIWANVQNTVTGCFAITSFDVVVSSNDFIIIPDPALKGALLSAGIEFNMNITGVDNLPVVVDQNSDGEIQFSEALLVYTMEVNDVGINTMQGVQYFTNLRRLSFWDNNVSSLDISPLTDLEYLNINNNNFTTLNVNGLLELRDIHAAGNLLSVLDVSNCPALETLQCEENGLTTLNISGLTNLTDLSCDSNQITTLDLSDATLLETIFCSGNLLSTLDVSGATNLGVLDCGSNAISILNLSSLAQLGTLWIDYNPIASLDVSTLQNLSNFSAANVPLTTLDVSNNPNLCNYFAVSGPNLEYINMKNGASCAVTYNLIGSPNLQFVCADVNDVELLSGYFTTNGMLVNVNSYCTPFPGGDYNTITGHVRFDADNNGCSPTDPTFPHIKLRLSSVDGEGVTYTQTDGTYSFFTNEGTFGLTPEIENQSFFDLFLPIGITFPTVDNSVYTQDFCVVANGIHPDVEVVVVPLTPSQPGFDAIYKIVYKNSGNQLLSGFVFFEFEHPYMNFVSSVPVPTNTLDGYLGYQYANLMPFENREIIVTLNINAPTDTPPVNLGDNFTYTASATITVGTDETPTNNLFAYTETVIGSFDPNDKTCVEGAVLSPVKIGEYLHYVINFENTGTAPAQNIVVRDVLNPLQFDVSTVQILNASHEVVARQNGNVMECIFQGINLDSGGHGNILLKVKTLSTLVIGDEVSNRADIYFDYNFPIVTNDATTSFESLGINENENPLAITFSPNPVSDSVTLKSVHVIENIELYDLQGRLLQRSLGSDVQFTLDMSNRQAGVYFIKASSGKDQSFVKISKD